MSEFYKVGMESIICKLGAKAIEVSELKQEVKELEDISCDRLGVIRKQSDIAKDQERAINTLKSNNLTFRKEIEEYQDVNMKLQTEVRELLAKLNQKKS